MITVFGSINLDLVVPVPRLPKAGETVSGPDHKMFPGGKGSNQAYAACLAGGNVRMVGAVGDDAFADLALENLTTAGVDTSGVRRLRGTTGLAFIGVDASGENQIIAANGANALVDVAWLDGFLEAGVWLVAQGEVPLEHVAQAFPVARERGAKVLWNPAPVPDQRYASLIHDVDVLIVNEGEAAHLANALNLPKDPEAFLAALSHPDRLHVVTLGGQGVIARQGQQVYRLPAPKTGVVDTTGAGDAFCGSMAAALADGADTGRSLARAVAAGSLACRAVGAQSSAPRKTEIIELAESIYPDLQVGRC
ncbi:ribokinase [Roseibium sp. RKSG952]|uniref:ribokinase n=1 Tax=Roseibium sp. RKSG952 TaxID=2529384 RepID=UPI0012BBC024|nr:ribokinase [Roseibium sp. RKSG952]MTH97494.1 ribokinase [Roseibium sp. RKSG952]